MKPQSWVLRPLYNLQLQMMSTTMRIKLKCSQWAIKELSMKIVLKRTNSPLPAKMAATSSLASEQSGTRVPKGRGGGDIPKISAFPANAPQPRGRGSSQGDKSPARTPRFSNNTGEGSASAAQGGRNRGPINRNPPLKPPGTIKTATKDKTKSKKKKSTFINHGSQLHNPVEL